MVLLEKQESVVSIIIWQQQSIFIRIHDFLKIPKIQTSLQNQHCQLLANVFYFLIISIIRSQTDGLAGKGTCCQLENLSLIPIIFIFEGENMLFSDCHTKTSSYPPKVKKKKSNNILKTTSCLSYSLGTFGLQPSCSCHTTNFTVNFHRQYNFHILVQTRSLISRSC